jgi:hypothetical protein
MFYFSLNKQSGLLMDKKKVSGRPVELLCLQFVFADS